MRPRSQPSVFLGFPLSLILICIALPSIAYADGFPILGVLHVGKRPEGIAVDTQTHMVYIADESPGLVVAFDPVASKVRWQVKAGDVATDVQVDSSTHRVYVTSFSRNRGTLTVLEGATGKVLLSALAGNGDNGLAFDTKRQRAYVSNNEDGTISMFTLVSSQDTGELTAQASLLHIGGRPAAVGVNSRLGRLYVADTNGHTVIVYDEDNGHKLTTIQVASGPVHPLRVDEATGRVFVVCSTGQELDVIDGNTNNVIAQVPVAPYPEGVAFNTATGRIYVADEGNKEGSNQQDIGTTITVIDGQTFDVLGTLKVGHAPDGVEADPALRRIYVTAEDSDAMVMVSDSVDLPLHVDTNIRQSVAAHRAIFFLQQATIITLLIMLLTIIAAVLVARSQRWRAPGSPQTPPGSASSR